METKLVRFSWHFKSSCLENNICLKHWKNSFYDKNGTETCWRSEITPLLWKYWNKTFPLSSACPQIDYFFFPYKTKIKNNLKAPHELTQPCNAFQGQGYGAKEDDGWKIVTLTSHCLHCKNYLPKPVCKKTRGILLQNLWDWFIWGRISWILQMAPAQTDPAWTSPAPEWCSDDAHQTSKAELFDLECDMWEERPQLGKTVQIAPNAAVGHTDMQKLPPSGLFALAGGERCYGHGVLCVGCVRGGWLPWKLPPTLLYGH